MRTKQNPADKVEQWPIEKLVPYAKNSRTHSDEQVAQIAASIREWGWTTPILVDEAGSIIAGHGRLQAARRLQMTEVPVVVASGWSEAQKRAYVIADNKLAMNAGWDNELLALELGELGELGFDVELTGFSDDEIKALMPVEVTEGLTDEDEVPEVPETPVSKTGDIWVLGEHKLLCGDATKAPDYAALLGDELVDMTFTDPPYNVNYANSAKDKLRGKNRAILNDNLGDGFGQFLHDACSNILSRTKGALYVAMSSSELDTLQSAFRRAGGPLVDLHHLGQEHLHARTRGLPAPVRADPLRLARRC
jgi:hypothetical protein